MAREFAARGYDLALCARRSELLAAVADECRALHPGVTVIVRELDVTDHDRVFTVLNEMDDEIGGLDRVVVNAGVGAGAPIGTGGFATNRQRLHTNLVAAAAQCEAAIGIFRRRGQGHLVVVSSVIAFRGMRGDYTTYAASKAGLSALAEGIRAEMALTPVRVTTIYPGHVATEIHTRPSMLTIDTPTAAAAMVRAIEREPAAAIVPGWPWILIVAANRVLPLRVVAAIMSRNQAPTAERLTT